jgi:hypothetical protein
MVATLALFGCDQGERQEIAMLREELAARSLMAGAQEARIEQLTAELEQVRADRQRCEADRVKPIVLEPPEPQPDAPPPTFAPRCAEDRCTVSRAQFEGVFAEQSGVVRMARVIPTLQDGKMTGLKLFAIRPDTPLALLGFKNGDEVRTLAGAELGDMDALLRAYAGLRTRNEWTITGLRKGAPFELTLAIE